MNSWNYSFQTKDKLRGYTTAKFMRTMDDFEQIKSEQQNTLLLPKNKHPFNTAASI